MALFTAYGFVYAVFAFCLRCYSGSSIEWFQSEQRSGPFPPLLGPHKVTEGTQEVMKTALALLGKTNNNVPDL